MIDQEANFLVEVLELVPEDSVFGFFANHDELLPDLEAAGYPVKDTRNIEIPVAEKVKLIELIKSKRLYRRVEHFDIMHGQEYLLKAYDHMISTWLSNKVNVSQSFIDRYSLEPDGEFWLVGDFLELDD